MSLDFTALDYGKMRITPRGELPTRIDIDLPSCPCGYLNFNDGTGAALRSLLRIEGRVGQMKIEDLHRRIDWAQRHFAAQAPRALEARKQDPGFVASALASSGARVIHVPYDASDLEKRLISLEEFVLAARTAGSTDISWS